MCVGVSPNILLLHITASLILFSLSCGFLDAPFYTLADGVPERLKLSTEFPPPSRT